MNIDSGEYYATELRNNLGLSTTESINIFDVLRYKEKDEISVVFKPFDTESTFYGATFVKDDIKLILINSANTYGRQIFTAAHEYFHLKYDNDLKMPDKEKEKIAELFASYFLMPEQGLMKVVNERQMKSGRKKLDISDMLFIENYFMISHHALCIRLKKSKYISTREYEILKDVRICSEARNYGYDTKLYLPTNQDAVISDYAERARNLLLGKQISISKYENLLLEAGYDISECEENDE